MKPRAALILLVVALGAARASAARQDNVNRRAALLAHVPASAAARVNPDEGNSDAVKAGRKLFLRHCAECHGKDLGGDGKAPALDSQRVAQAPPGDLFWFITNGNLRRGMPPWARLPEQQRWQIVTYLKSLHSERAH